MKIGKILGIVAAVALSAGSAYAAKAVVHKDAVVYKDDVTYYDGGIGLGMNYATEYGGDWALMLSYLNADFYAGIGTNFEWVHPKGVSTTNLLELRGDIGLRRRLCQNLFFTYGLAGSYGFRSKITSTRGQPYAIGVASGLNWQPVRHFLLGAEIMPYMYTRSYDLRINNTIFTNGAVTFSYIF